MVKRLIAFAVILMIILTASACDDKTEGVSVDGKKVVTYACMNLNKTDENILNIAAQRFNQNNPDYVMNIKDYAKSGYSIDKYLSTLNTELMSGKGPDIISTRDLPVIKYIKKNIFLSLDSVLSNDKEYDPGMYFTNIIDACKYKENTYFIPVYFNISAVVGSKTSLEKEGVTIDDKKWTMSDFVQIANKVTKDLDGDGTIDRYALPKIPMEAVAQLFINMDNYVDYENMKANFDSSQFIELLESLKILYDNKLTHKKISIAESIPYKDSMAIVFSGGDINGYRGMLSTKYRLGGGERSFFRLPLSSQSRDTSFDSKMTLAINNSSKNKELAWDFMKLLLSEEVQMLFAGSESTSGFPIHKEAYKKQLEGVKNLDWRLKDSGGWIPVRFTDDEIKYVDEYINDINQYNFRDARMEKIVIDEIGALFAKGFSFKKKDAENVAKSIQNRVKLYLEE